MRQSTKRKGDEKLETEKITIKEAAKRLHKSEQFVRVGLQRNILPIGYAMQISNKKWTYYISPIKLKELTGNKD